MNLQILDEELGKSLDTMQTMVDVSLEVYKTLWMCNLILVSSILEYA